MQFNVKPVKKNKIIKDYVHKMISVDHFFFKFIDTSQFQRLRYLYEIPSGQYVYPSANHRKFEHSLGTFHVANEFLNHFTQKEINIPNKIKNSILLAALCHNLGSGPLGNNFNIFCNNNFGPSSFDIGSMSEKIIDNIIEKEGIEPESLLEDEAFDLSLLKKIVNPKGKNVENNSNSSSYFYENIINNKKNIIDANLFDKICRDYYCFGLPKNAFDYQILLKTMNIINNNICFRKSDVETIYELLNRKYDLEYRQHYHKVASGIDLMFQDILRESNSYYKFDTAITDVEAFLKLNDNLLSLMYHSKSNQLEKARNLIDRLNHRNLYKYIGGYETSKFKNWINSFNEETILNYTSSDEVEIKKEDFRVLKIDIHLGFSNEDPIKNILFYEHDNHLTEIKKEEISHMITNKFVENIIRVYAINKDDIKKIKAIESAFSKFIQEKTGFRPTYLLSEQKPFPSEPRNFTGFPQLNLFNNK